jgi:PAS domain S-box-containing protein
MEDLAIARMRYLDGEPAPAGVRAVVLASWERCRALGVDPRGMPIQVPDSGRLREARQRSRALLRAAEPWLNHAHGALSELPHLLALADREGVILRVLTGPGLRADEMERSTIFEGASCNERDIGCNGVGTCLATGEPVILTGPEHFRETYAGWTDIGVPMRCGGEIVGALNLSVPDGQSHVHTWGWMLSIGKAIETSIAGDPAGGRVQVERVVMDLEAPFHGVRGVFELLTSQIELSPSHAGLLEDAGAKLAEAEAHIRLTVGQLHESEERLRRIAESGMVGLLFWEMGGRISYANDRFLEMVGYGRGELEAGVIDWRAMTPREWEPVDLAAVEQIRSVGATRPFEKEFIHKDGSRVPVLLSAAAFSGTSERGVTLVLDMSERKRAEQERQRLLEAERMARLEAERSAQVTSLITTHLANGICMIDAEGRLTYMNPAAERILGWTHAEIEGKVLHDVVHFRRPDGRAFPLSECPLGQVLSAQKPVLGLVDQWIRKDGSFVPLVTTCAPIMTEGRVVGAVLSMHDDSDRRRAEAERERLLRETESSRAEAEAANRAKMEFLSAMSHELRTPLNAIGAYVELLDMGIHGPVTTAQQTALSRIGTNQRHLLTLINDILQFARLEAGQVEIELHQLRAAELLLSIDPLVAPSAAAKGIAYSVQRDGEDAALLGDAERVRQILLNLVANAIKFTPEGGWVLLSCDVEGAWVSMRVRDNGPGIAAEKHEAIFDPFVQVDRRLNRPHDGVGLGLAISRDLARAMGGDLSVESAAGEGSTFTLRLPRAGLAPAPQRSD